MKANGLYLVAFSFYKLCIAFMYYGSIYFFSCRIFLLMDPTHGEISRAMRNRGIEIFILPEVSASCFLR